jgi:hypothetical protein
MRLLENWVDQRIQQQVVDSPPSPHFLQTHPATTKKTFFDDTALSSTSQPSFHGHIFDGMGGTAAQERKGVTLKVLAHEISLSEHPYVSALPPSLPLPSSWLMGPQMSEEEVACVALKRLYSQYSKHLRSKAYEYLPYRLLSLITELRSVIHPFNTAQQDLSLREYESMVDRLYCDLLETLPVLCEYKATLQDLESNVYSTWRRLIELRRKQGFVSTRAILIAKNLHFSSTRPRPNPAEGKGDEKDDGDGPDDDGHASGGGAFNASSPANRYWKELLPALSSLPDLMKSAFEKSHPPLIESTNPSNMTLTPGQPPLSVSTPQKKSYSSVPPPSSIAKKVQTEKPLQHAKAIEMIESAVEYLSPPRVRETSSSDPHEVPHSSILPSLVYRLSNTGAITSDDLVPIEEAERRNKLRRVRVRIVLKVHGQIVSSSRNYQLQWPELKVTIDQLYELRVLRQAASVVFDLFVSYELKSSLLTCCAPLLAHETLVATVGVPLSQRLAPSADLTAHPALCYSPSIAWYEFMSQHLIDASHGRGLVYVNNKPTSNLSTIRLAGALLCGSEYDIAYDPLHNSITSPGYNTVDGVYGGDIAYIPPLDKGSGGLGGGGGRSLIGGKLDFTKEKDFFDLLPSLHLLDTHDPRNDLLVQHHLHGLLSGRLRQRNIFQFGGEYFASVYSEEGMSYGNYFKYQPSNRLQLLRLRELKPYLFTEPIPLSEELIKGSELFKKILLTESKAMMGRQQGGGSHLMVDYLREASGGDDGGLEGDGLDSEEEVTIPSDLLSRHALKANTFLSRVRDTQTVISRNARKKKV